jgi:hypothetical protein
MGTPEYSSPEQCETDDLDARTDIYSLGVVLFELMTGRTPHTGDTPLSLFKKITEQDPPPIRSLNPSVPEDVAALVHAMLARDRNGRPARMADVVAGIDRCDHRAPIAAAPAGVGRRAVAAFAVTALVALGVVFGLMLPKDQPTPPAPKPEPPPAVKLDGLVFDFTLKSPSGPDDWMTVGVADLLARTLGQYEHLAVPTRDQVAAKAEPTPDQRDAVLDAFSPHAYITGQITVMGEDVRVDITVHRGTDDSVVFSMPYLRKKGNFLPVVDDMATAIAERLRREGASLVTAAVAWVAPPETRPVEGCQTIAANYMPMVSQDQEVRALELLDPDEKVTIVPDVYRVYMDTGVPDDKARVTNDDLARLWFRTQIRARGHASAQKAMADLNNAFQAGEREKGLLALRWADDAEAPFSREMFVALTKGELMHFICPKCPGVEGEAGKICEHCNKPFQPSVDFEQVIEKLKKKELERGPPVKPPE